jgi:hypothetical protein
VNARPRFFLVVAWGASAVLGGLDMRDGKGLVPIRARDGKAPAAEAGELLRSSPRTRPQWFCSITPYAGPAHKLRLDSKIRNNVAYNHCSLLRRRAATAATDDAKAADGGAPTATGGVKEASPVESV